MAIRTAIVTVTDEPTRLDVASDDFRTGQDIIIRPSGASVKVGGETLSQENGWEVAAGDEFIKTLGQTDRLFAIAAEGTTVDVSVLQGGVG